MKVIHCGDIHLRNTDTVSGEIRNRRSEGHRSFMRIVTYCKDNNVDVLLISGDLFEDTTDITLARKVSDALAMIPNTDVYICSGNHDPNMPNSVYRTVDWPGNVTIFGGNFKVYVNEAKGYRIVGAGFDAPYVSKPLLAGVELPVDNLINLGILHGELVAEGAASVYNPVYRSDIEHSKIDYLALGHIHLRSNIERIGRTAFSYCGNSEGYGFDECGSKGFYLLNISKENNQVKLEPFFVRTAIREYAIVEVDVKDYLTINDAQSSIIAILNEKFGPQFRNNYYRIILNGTYDKNRHYNSEDLKNELSEILHYVEIKDNSSMLPDYMMLAESNNLLGAFTRKMQKDIATATANGDDALAERLSESMRLGIMAFSGEVNVDED